MITRLIIIAAALVSCLRAQRPIASISPAFARYGIHALTAATPVGDAELTARLGPDVMTALSDLRPHVALLRNDGPHTIMHVIWIKEDFARRYTAVEATLDSVILNNGTIVGPDLYGWLEFRRAQYAANAELSVKMNDASVSDEQLDAWLAEVSERPFTFKPNGLPDHASAIGSSARMVRVIIKQHGRAKVATLYSQVTQKNSAATQFIQVKE